MPEIRDGGPAEGFIIRQLGEIEFSGHDGISHINGVLLEGDIDSIRAVGKWFGERVSLAPLTASMPEDVKGLVERLSFNGRHMTEDRHEAEARRLAERSDAATALASLSAKVKELDDECQQSMLDIARERERAETAEASLAERDRIIAEKDKALEEEKAKLANEEKRSEALVKLLDRAREGKEPDYCYDPNEWEFTCSWDERDQVHGYGDGLPLGEIMQVATLVKGPRKWVAHIPVTWNEDGDPEDTRIEWFDSEEAARAARDRRAS